MSLLNYNNQDNYFSRFFNIAGTALLCLREQYPNVYFYFFEPEYWLFFFDVSQQYVPDIHVLDITSNITIAPRPEGKHPNEFLSKEDPIIYVGHPSHLIQLCKDPIVGSRANPIIFASIPVYSYWII